MSDMSDVQLRFEYSKKHKTYFVFAESNPKPVIELGTEVDAMAYVVAATNLTVFEDIKRMIEKFPQLEARGLRGALLFLHGHVRKHPDRQHSFKVLSQPGTVSYTVDATPGGMLSCTCPDYRNNAPEIKNGVKFCKHIIAQVLFYRYQMKPQMIAQTFKGKTIVTPIAGQAVLAAYHDGSPIDDDVLTHAQIYHERVGAWPVNRDKLMAWIYR